MAYRFNYVDQIVGANGRKWPLLSISATTSTGVTALPATDAVGKLPPGQLICLQGAQDFYYNLGQAFANGTFTVNSGGTSSGVLHAVINGTDISVTYATSATHTGDLLVAAIKANAATNALVSAVNASGTVTVTSKSVGAAALAITTTASGTHFVAGQATLAEVDIVADATCVFVKAGYQELVYLWFGTAAQPDGALATIPGADTTLALMCATDNGVVNVFSLR